MKRTLAAAAAALLVVLAAPGVIGLQANLENPLPPQPIGPVGNDVGCRIGTGTGGYAAAGTPDGPCNDWMPTHTVAIEYLVLVCPDPQPWGYCGFSADWYDDSTWEYQYQYYECQPGSRGTAELATGAFSGSGACQLFAGGSSAPTPPSSWPFWRGYGSGEGGACFTFTDNVVDAIYHDLVDFGLTC